MHLSFFWLYTFYGYGSQNIDVVESSYTQLGKTKTLETQTISKSENQFGLKIVLHVRDFKLW